MKKRQATEVIDLTEGDNNNVRRRLEGGESSSSSSQVLGEAVLKTKYGSGHAISRSSTSSLSQSTNTNDENDDDDVVEEYYGFIKVNVVGTKYYTGILSEGENVLLMREPSNPYDKNAIAAFNILHQQTGHVEAKAAVHLAPLIDKGMLYVEGVLGVRVNEWAIPLFLHCYGSPEDSEKVKAVLQRNFSLKMDKKKKPKADKKGKGKGKRKRKKKTLPKKGEKKKKKKKKRKKKKRGKITQKKRRGEKKRRKKEEKKKKGLLKKREIL
eukprot:TRINITY_DN13681_c0_g1_i1.p1 TRINITY_DN13681_c0_g1~~TRINITY_DN13681_c0_g1_i1.p1  ORF type:complete len:294 (-),score=91.73 TRINITY_DN13681_c0_g1_i1:171-974(-)